VGDDVFAITATDAARTNASERKMKVFTVQLRTNPADTLPPVCFVPISSDGENGFVAFGASPAKARVPRPRAPI
jgi:hypothetical protein